MFQRISLFSIGLLGVLSVLGAVSPALAQSDYFNDGSIFQDEFNGTSLDGSKWTTETFGTPGSITVGGGYANILSTAASGGTVLTSTPTLNYGGAATWAADMRFRIASGTTVSNGGNRQQFILTAMDADPLAAYGRRDFDIRALQGSTAGTFDLGWDGFDNENTSRNATPALITGLARDVFHDLRVVHNADNSVDIYLNDFDTPIATRPALTNPSTTLFEQAATLRFGDPSSTITTDFDIDFIRYGQLLPPPLTPEPGTVFLFGTALVLGGGFAYRRRLRAE